MQNGSRERNDRSRKTVKSRYLRKQLTNFDNIWHSDAYGHSRTYQALKIALLKIWDSARRHVEKSSLCLKGLMVMHIASLRIPTILRNKTANITQIVASFSRQNCPQNATPFSRIKCVYLFTTATRNCIVPYFYCCSMTVNISNSNGPYILKTGVSPNKHGIHEFRWVMPNIQFLSRHISVPFLYPHNWWHIFDPHHPFDRGYKKYPELRNLSPKSILDYYVEIGE